MIEIVPGERALFVEELRAIVVADLHIGYEKALRAEGLIIRDPTEEMLSRLEALITRIGAEKLVILGDVKHSIGPCRKVKRIEELPAEVLVVKGNHDGNIEDMLDVKIYPRGFRMGDYGFIHGHLWPPEEIFEAKYVFMGHLHPEIDLEDSIGKVHRYPCHLVGRLTAEGRKRYGGDPRVFVLPAFNPLVGSALADPLGPLMRNGIIGDFEVYLLNGTYLGRMEELRTPRNQ